MEKSTRIKSNNPFTLDFGREPTELIPRTSALEDLLQAFSAEVPSQHTALVTGIRGSGKTVFMTTVSKRLNQEKNWITVELSPEQDLLQSLVVKLGNEKKLVQIMKRAKINLSYFGVGLQVEGGETLTDPETALERMLDGLQRHKKRLLVTIDEVVNNANIRLFSSIYQILLRKDLPIFLLMTGLYENLRSLQDEKTLTFLYRAPRIPLQPLNIGIITDSYQRIFDIEREKALQMARETRGFSFAFQVLGYFTWQYPEDQNIVQSMYRQHLEEYVYEKIWMELSPMDRKVVFAIVQTPEGKIKDIREKLGMNTNQFNPYRMRLIRKGLVNGNVYGELRFILPLFEKFVLESADSIQPISIQH